MKCLNRPIFSLRVHISFIRQLLVSFPFPFRQVQDITTCGTKNEKKLLDFFSLHVHILYNLMDPDTAFSRFQETIRHSSPSCLPTSRVGI